MPIVFPDEIVERVRGVIVAHRGDQHAGRSLVTIHGKPYFAVTPFVLTCLACAQDRVDRHEAYGWSTDRAQWAREHAVRCHLDTERK
jgi:hypothetical protein